MIVQLSKQQAEFIKANAEMYSVGQHWYRFPHWYHHIKGNLFEVVSYDEIPEGVKKSIEKFKDENPKK